MGKQILVRIMAHMAFPSFEDRPRVDICECEGSDELLPLGDRIGVTGR